MNPGEIEVGFGAAPESLTEDERARWRDIERIRGATLRRRHRRDAELLARIWARYRRGELDEGQRGVLRSLFYEFRIKASHLSAEDQGIWGAEVPSP